MDTQPAMDALKQRAFDARTPLYKLCQRAEVSSAAFTRSAAGRKVSVAVLGKLEDAMAAIEAERGQ